MKKCPFCAEEIKDEAIVCRYCGRDLPQVQSFEKELIHPTQQFTPQKPKASSWAQSAKIAAVLTALAALGILVRYMYSPTELLASLVIGSVVNFFFWWLLLAGIIALARKIGWASIIVIVILLLVVAVVIVLLALSGRNLSFTLVPTQTPTKSGLAWILEHANTKSSDMSIGLYGSLSCPYEDGSIVISGKVYTYGGTKAVTNVEILGWLCNQPACLPEILQSGLDTPAPAEIASNTILIDYLAPGVKFPFQIKIPVPLALLSDNGECNVRILGFDK